jgi:pyruvate ferredoxin oxidoreductase alpha subunit
MGKRVGVEVSIAAADAIAMADVDVVAAYPITPQTHIVEHLAELVADGKLDAQFIPVESEHSAMSVCCGSSAVGARTFTCTSSQGLALMNEIVFAASSLRLPIVMFVVNRALSAPINIWNDHSDTMSIRDCGWIQIFAANSQEVFDSSLFAFQVAENPEVCMPLIVNMDGFMLSHMIEPVEYWEQEQVNKFLPEFKPVFRLDPDKPVTIGALGMPNVFTEVKMSQDQALINSKPHILEAWKNMGDITGRYYNPVEEYQMEDAETVFITMGSIGGAATLAVDDLRSQGKAAGQLRIRLWRPFPFDEIRQALKGKKRAVVIDRAVSFGGPGGPVASEVRSALYQLDDMPIVNNYICGLGGRDVTQDDFITMYEQAEKTSKEEQHNYTIYGVRG